MVNASVPVDRIELKRVGSILGIFSVAVELFVYIFAFWEVSD